MLPVLVQHASNTVVATSGTSVTLTVTLPGNITPGNCVFAYVSWVLDSTLTPTTTTVTTNGAADRWDGGTGFFTSSTQSAVFADPGSAGGQAQVKITVAWTGAASPTANVAVLADVYEFSGVAGSPADVNTGNTGTGTSWSSTATGTTTRAAEVWTGGLTAFRVGTATFTGPSSPWVNEPLLSVSAVYGGTTYHVYQLSGYQVVSAVGAATYSGTASASLGGWESLAVTWKAAQGRALVVPQAVKRAAYY